MAKARLLLACVLSMQIYEASSNTQSVKLQLIKENVKPIDSPLETFPMQQVYGCALACMKASICQSVSYGNGICSIYAEEYNPSELVTATGLLYYKSGAQPKSITYKMITSQSSSNSSQYAVDGKYDVTIPSLDAHCSATGGGSDIKPWWRYKFEEELWLSNVILYTTENDQLHNIEIRIGKDDVNDTKVGGIIDINTSCKKISGFLDTKNDKLGRQQAVLQCTKPIYGQFMSVQVLTYCTGSNCTGAVKASPILSLCQVQVYPVLGNVALRKPAKQSSNYNTFVASSAVDGDLTGLISHTNNQGYPWWRVDLQKDHYVKQVIVYNRGGSNLNKRFHDVEIRVSQIDIATIPYQSVFKSNDGDTLCATVGVDAAVPAGKNEITCTKPLAGRYVSLQIVRDCNKKFCTDSGNSHAIHVHEVEVIGIPLSYLTQNYVTNWAAKKPAVQSSTSGGYGPQTAVDTVLGSFAITENGRNSWWRVDLGADYYITAVFIQNHPYLAQSQMLHDIEIRVSNEDISKITKGTVFNPKDDSLCAEAGRDEAIPPAGTTFNCTKPLAGRYVSIQIVRNCKEGRTNCNKQGDGPGVHIIQIGEVYAIGLPLNSKLEEIWQNHNVLASTSHQGNSTQTVEVERYTQSSAWSDSFSPVWADSDIPSQYLYTPHPGQCAFTDYRVITPAWWHVTLSAIYQVEKVIIFTPGYGEFLYDSSGELEKKLEDWLHVELHDFIIRAGNSSITPPPKDNAVCKEGNRLPLSRGVAEAQCNPAIKGKYVSIEVLKPCGRKECVFLKSTALYLCKVEVQGKVAET